MPSSILTNANSGCPCAALGEIDHAWKVISPEKSVAIGKAPQRIAYRGKKPLYDSDSGRRDRGYSGGSRSSDYKQLRWPLAKVQSPKSKDESVYCPKCDEECRWMRPSIVLTDIARQRGDPNML